MIGDDFAGGREDEGFDPPGPQDFETLAEREKPGDRLFDRSHRQAQPHAISRARADLLVFRPSPFGYILRGPAPEFDFDPLRFFPNDPEAVLVEGFEVKISSLAAAGIGQLHFPDAVDREERIVGRSPRLRLRMNFRPTGRHVEAIAEGKDLGWDIPRAGRQGLIGGARDRTEGLNLDVEIEMLQDRLRRFDATLRQGKERPLNLNLLFYGPPGTGKTALARHLSASLDREIHCRRYSDLQSKYVGEGEWNIRKAFEDAQGAEAVLLVDEIDSMLFDRDTARNSWEITFVNEFLAQMETFRGILICTTNRLTGLDPAAMRRFTLNVRFDYLTAEGNLVFYRKLLEPIARTRMGPDELAALRRIRHLAPADFARVRDRYALDAAADPDHAALIRELEAESRLKGIDAGKRRIGFRGD